MAQRTDSGFVCACEHCLGHGNVGKLFTEPPAYEHVQAKPVKPEPLTLKWDYHSRRDSHSYWTRKIPHDKDDYWLQCGVSRHFDTQSPDCQFTCKMMPTHDHGMIEFTLSRLEECCERIARSLQAHHNESNHHTCRCDFKYIRTGGDGKAAMCHQGSKHYAKAVWSGMEEHDKLCRCGCFDCPSPKTTKQAPVSAWRYHPGSGCRSYWSRRLRQHEGVPWLQCGVSSGPHTNGPDSLFTCKMIPRAGAKLLNIRFCCESVAAELKAHRADERYDNRSQAPACSCDFKFIRTGISGKAGLCCRCWSKQANAEAVWRAMNQHDQLCLCGCFDYPSPKRLSSNTPIYTEWKRVWRLTSSRQTHALVTSRRW